MADIGSIADKKACGSSQTPNTGKLGCLSLFDAPDSLLAIRKGFKIPANTVFDLAYLTPLIQKGDIIPLINASSFEDVSSEDTYSTNSAGVKRLNLKGLPEYKFMYEEGNEFYRELDKMTSFKAFDFIIGDVKGNWMVTVNSDGSYGGFTAGHATAELRKNSVQGGDAESKSLLIQFLDRLQLDRNYSILHQDQLDFVPSEIPAVNGCHIELVAVPADSDTKIDVTVHLNSDHTTTVAGMDKTEFLIKVDGATAVIALATESPEGQYQLDIPALSTGEIVTIETFSGGTNSNVAEVSGVLFRSVLVTVTVVA